LSGSTRLPRLTEELVRGRAGAAAGDWLDGYEAAAQGSPADVPAAADAIALAVSSRELPDCAVLFAAAARLLAVATDSEIGARMLPRFREAALAAASVQKDIEKEWAAEAGARGGETLGDETHVALARRVLDRRGSDGTTYERFDMFCEWLLQLTAWRAERVRIRADRELVAAVRAFEAWPQSPRALAARVFAAVADGQRLLVLHPAQRRGYRVDVYGVTHNYRVPHARPRHAPSGSRSPDCNSPQPPALWRTGRPPRMFFGSWHA
jgi:hypothetical protein